MLPLGGGGGRGGEGREFEHFFKPHRVFVFVFFFRSNFPAPLLPPSEKSHFKPARNSKAPQGDVQLKVC